MHGENLESLVLGDVLEERARTHRGETFLKLRDGEATFDEVDAMANRVAQGFAAMGVERGDHVAVMLPNGADFVHVVFALARLGAVAVPINTEYRGDLLRHVLATSDASVLVVDGPFVERVVRVAAEVPDLDLVVVRGGGGDGASRDHVGKPTKAFAELLGHGDDRPGAPAEFSDMQAIMYTSGTTGRAKGAMVPHALALTCALDSVRFVSGGARTIYCPLPLFHAAGLWDGMMAALVQGCAIAIVERFSASRFWEDVRHFDAQVAMGVFSMIPILLSQPPDPRDRDHPLESFYMGKSALDGAMQERFGVRAVETYTSTEAGIPIASPYGEWRTGSCGQVHGERFEAAVVDEHDREVGPDEPGELVLRPKQPSIVTAGYYGHPEVTAQCFRNLWFHTGDRVHRDADGYFYFLDRIKDAIRRRGENISAFDLECTVNLHPAVSECAAIGVPSELEEEEVKLVVVVQRDTDLDPEELAAFCEEQLPSFMVPRYVEVVDELPRTPTDKVAKHRLREQGDDGMTPGTRDLRPGGHRATAPRGSGGK